MQWNYRVFRVYHNGEPWLQVHETYYAPDGVTPVGYTADPSGVEGATLAELRHDAQAIYAAFDKPILRDINGQIEEVG